MQEPCPVRSIKAVAYCHSTEDCDRVAKALRNVLPGEIHIEKVTGYYGNVITMMYAEVVGCYATTIFANILKSIDNLDFQILLNNINIYKNKLFIRFNKQKALQGLLRLDSGDDVIHVEVRVPRAAANSLIETFVRLRGSGRGSQEKLEGGGGPRR
ncbi:MAG: RNA-binding domain-containing protein [Thermoproteus sp.]